MERRAGSVERALAIMVATYGLLLARTATHNIRETRKRAEGGDLEAQRHFTQTRYARVLGVRNSDLAMLFYGMVGLASLTGAIRRPSLQRSLLLGSAASVVLSLYLLWALLFRLRVWCAICMRAHAVNVALFAILLRLAWP